MNYFDRLSDCFGKIETTDKKGKAVSFEKAVSGTVSLAITSAEAGNKIMIVGNGGSASIASHIAIDFLKNAGIPAVAFNDASSLTCLANDLGYEEVFAKPVEMLSRKGDIFIAISSSGKSSNILKAAEAAGRKNNFIVTLSGFGGDNPLRKTGDINFYVPSSSYGHIEITHLAICHRIVDAVMDKRLHG